MTSKVNEVINIRLTTVEYDAVKKAAKSYQMSPQGMAYQALMLVTQKRLDDLKEPARLVTENNKGIQTEGTIT